ncbi:MAG: ECF-type sigma factor [Dehalococcoidia bacterium]|nr:ECF-type sigma factor [Dehalococcoidia bacterium]
MAERDHHDHSLAASEPKLTAPADLMVAVYGQLRALAQQQLASERPGHTLSATALVHEAYLRLAAGRRSPGGRSPLLRCCGRGDAPDSHRPRQGTLCRPPGRTGGAKGRSPAHRAPRSGVR